MAEESEAAAGEAISDLDLFDGRSGVGVSLRRRLVGEEGGGERTEELGRGALSGEVGLVVVEEQDELQHRHRILLLPTRHVLVWPRRKTLRKSTSKYI